MYAIQPAIWEFEDLAELGDWGNKSEQETWSHGLRRNAW